MALEELGHAEGADLVLSEDGLHLGVGLEVLLVLGVLELVRLEVGPDSLDHLGPGQLLTLLGSNEVSELGAQGQRLGQSGSLQEEAVTKRPLFYTGYLGGAFLGAKNGYNSDNKQCQWSKIVENISFGLTLGIL